MKSIEYTDIADGEYFLVTDANDMVVSAQDEGGSALAAVKDTYAGAWETIYVTHNNDGTVSFRSGANNKYVCAVIDEDKQLLARSTEIQDWEKFDIIKVTNDQYAIQSLANGKYVRADITSEGKCMLKADSDKIQEWECFRMHLIGQ